MGRKLRALAGGGRYDHLMSKFGYPDLPTCGFAIGDVTLTELLDVTERLPRYIDSPELYLVIGGLAERQVALADLCVLRDAGFHVDYPLRPLSFGKQFKLADQACARLALIYGAHELAKDQIKIRDLNRGEEHFIPRTDLVTSIRTALACLGGGQE